jgi:PPOX class probable F420-dependent enzyme
MAAVTITPGIQTVLERPLDAAFATIRPDGTPEIAPVWFLWRDGALVVSTSVETRRWANLQRDPRCSVLIDDLENGCYVAIYGKAELIRGDVRAFTRDVVARYIEADRVESYLNDTVYTGAERTIIRVKPDRLVAFGVD